MAESTPKEPAIQGDSTERPARRSFLAGAAAGLLLSQIAPPAAAEQAAQSETSATDFARSYMHCAPNKSGIWVRIQMECLCTLVDRAAGRSEQFALGAVAKTGVGKNPKTGALSPGYDYWLIFSKDKIWTRRTHASSYLKNPTILTIEEFGPIGWQLHPAAATPLQSAGDVRKALQGWRRIVARSEFASSDGRRSFSIEYPVKWADCGVEKDSYRVETGPIVFLDPDRFGPGDALKVESFEWMYVDIHSADLVRCLINRPTHILSEASFFPPKEDKRDARENPSLTDAQVKSIEDRLLTGWETPVPPAAMRELFQTDHYSGAAERRAVNTLYAID